MLVNFGFALYTMESQWYYKNKACRNFAAADEMRDTRHKIEGRR